MHLSGHLRFYFASLFFWLLFLSHGATSYPSQGISIPVELGIEARSVLPPLSESAAAPLEKDDDEITSTGPSLNKRAPTPARILWNSAPERNAVNIGHFKKFELSKDHSEVFKASFCYGCTVVVVGSGKKLLISHIPEQAGKKYTFEDNDAYAEYAEDPLENLLEPNKDDMGTRPAVMVFMPPARSASQERMTKLLTAIQMIFPRATIERKLYIKRSAFDDDQDKANGRVTVAWKAPDEGTNEALLDIYAEDTKVISNKYTCIGEGCEVESN